MTCKHVNTGEIKLTFTNIRETTIEVNEYNSECTRVVLHIYEDFTWYLITIIVPRILYVLVLRGTIDFAPR